MPRAAQVPPSFARLAVETTGFVGRVSELAALGSLLESGRLVTVTGPGGAGKTRLALRAAGAAGPSYRDGVALADLADLRDADRLPRAVGAALRLPVPDGVPPLDAVVRRLRDCELLLVLDTCEPLVDAAALFAEAVLRAAPGVRILATSRQPLDVAGECMYPVGGLDEADALELFEQRAAAAVAGFAVTGQNRDDVLRICRGLGGIPLALELAAIRLRALAPDVLADRIDRALPLLAGGRRGSTARHRALRDTIGWSFDLCTRAEQVLWQRLSAFEGTLSLAAAEEVCAGGPLARGDVLETLISLVDKSVVTKTDHGGFRVPGIIREYGALRLAGSPGEEARVRGLLLAHYLRRAEEFDRDPLTGQLSRYRALRAEHDSIRGVLRRGFALPGAVPASARLVTSLFWYWHFSGRVAEAREWLGLALEKLAAPSAERAGALMLWGMAAAAAGDVTAGLRDCRAGLAMAKAARDERGYARGHLYYCQALLAAGREQEAITAGRTAASLMPAAGDARAADLLPVFLALAHAGRGEFRQALDLAGHAMTRMPADGEERWAASVLYAVTGVGLFLTGETGRGASAFRQSLSASRALGDPVGVAYGLGLLGCAAAGQGRHARAAWLLGAGRPLHDRASGAAFLRIPRLVALARQAADDARAGLGDDAFDDLVTAAARCPLETAVDLAVSDSDDLPVLGPAPSGGAPAAAPHAGPSPAARLTGRQREIADLAARGLSNREIAGHLVISKRTVDTHVSHIFRKLGVTSRAQLPTRLADGVTAGKGSGRPPAGR